MSQLVRLLVATNAKILEVSAENLNLRSQTIHIGTSAQAERNLSKHVPPILNFLVTLHNYVTIGSSANPSQVNQLRLATASRSNVETKAGLPKVNRVSNSLTHPSGGTAQPLF